PSVDKVLGERVAVSYERELPEADGTPRWIEVHLIPQLGENGEPVASCVMINDITKHRLAERQVRESQARLDKFMQATVEGILFHREGLMTDVNPPLCAMLGYAPEELIGQHVLSFVAQDELAKVSEVM